MLEGKWNFFVTVECANRKKNFRCEDYLFLRLYCDG